MTFEVNKSFFLKLVHSKIDNLHHDAYVVFSLLLDKAKNNQDGTYTVDTFVPNVLKELTNRTSRERKPEEAWTRERLAMFVKQLRESGMLSFEKLGPEMHRFVLGKQIDIKELPPCRVMPLKEDRFLPKITNSIARKALDEAKTLLKSLDESREGLKKLGRA